MKDLERWETGGSAHRRRDAGGATSDILHPMPRSAMGTDASGAIPHVVDAPALIRGLVARHAGLPVQPAPQDVYKLLYHAALGSEHAVATRPALNDGWRARWPRWSRWRAERPSRSSSRWGD